MRQIFLDCSYIYGTDERTGIQRVVRNILNESKMVGEKMQLAIHYVVWERGKFREVSWPPVQTERNRQQLLKQVIWKSTRLILPPAVFARADKYWKMLKPELTNLLDSNKETGNAVAFQEGDTLILLDSSWGIPYWREVASAKKAGANIGFVLYDLVPIRQPEFSDVGVIAAFESWLPKSIQWSDFCLAISETSRLELVAYLKEHGSSNRLRTSSFRMGANLDDGHKQMPRTSIKKLFAQAAKPYICIGTIEPRKNQAFLIDAFDKLWHQSSYAKLCLIGRTGWHTEELIGRIKRHPKYGKGLFLFTDMNDGELELAYKSARALIAPSLQEGYGLPIIEALRYQLPVFASDIPIFREVGGEYCAYFSLNSPDALVGMISNFDETNKFPAIHRAKKFQWLNWQQSTKQFLETALSLSDRAS